MVESSQERSSRILKELERRHPNTSCWDVDGSSHHFVSELEPSSDHPEYDRAVEVIIRSKPHKHIKMKQHFKVLTGNLELHVEQETFLLKPGDEHIVDPGRVHWAISLNEAWVEIYSEPGWTKADHIPVEIE